MKNFLVEYLKTLTDAEVHEFLTKQADLTPSESEDEFNTAPEQLAGTMSIGSDEARGVEAYSGEQEARSVA